MIRFSGLELNGEASALHFYIYQGIIDFLRCVCTYIYSHVVNWIPNNWLLKLPITAHFWNQLESNLYSNNQYFEMHTLAALKIYFNRDQVGNIPHRETTRAVSEE